MLLKSKKLSLTAVLALLGTSLVAPPAWSEPGACFQTCDIAQGQLDFSEGKLNGAGALIDQNTTSTNLGAAAAVGTYIEYYNVLTIGGTQIDAKLTLSDLSGMESGSGLADNKVEIIDAYLNDLVEPEERINNEFYADVGIGDEWLEYTIDFFTDLATTPVPVTLENIVLSVYDIDAYQYAEMSGISQYYFSSSPTTILSAIPRPGGVTRFISASGVLSSASNMESRVEVEYDSASTVILRLGQENPDDGSGYTGGSFSLDFSALTAWGAGVRAAAAAPPSVAPAPYTGPLLQEFSSRTLDVCTPKSITITGIRLLGATASVQGKSVTVLENTDTKLVLAFPAGLTPGNNVDLVIKSSSGTLTHQDAFDIPADTCAAVLSKGRWTQLQSDGKTVKIYAKDPVGDGKIQFFVDGKEIAWVNAVDEADPKLSFASSYPYLVRSVALHEAKNRFEIKLDGVRVWRATYVPKG